MPLRSALSRRTAALIAACGVLLAGLAAPLAASAQETATGRATGTVTGPATGTVAPTSAAAALADVRAMRTANAPKLDGRLDDAIWAEAPAVEGFRQNQPNNGAPSAQRTVVRIVYDDAAVYVGARMHDTAPDSIVARLGRRDSDGDSDVFAVFFDSFHDRRSGYFFGVNAAGTVLDGTLSNDGNRDDSWDGVWEGKVARDAEGWTAELRIPYSQLRFARADVQLWGVNFGRFIPRRGEEAYLRVAPANENAFVSYFADLRGIERVRPGRGLEIVPYITTRADFADAPAGDPFRDGSRMRVEAGGDVKFALTPNLTLSATVNPDFGQVEVDPAEVNLSGFETFFSERRPFFVEGSSNYDFGGGGSSRDIGFNWVNNDLFYTRRIGRQPQGSLPGGRFEDVPEASRILGAAKLTGRVAGTNIGILSSVTNREMGRYATGPEGGPLTTARAEVEPLTHYGVVRALREFSGGRQGLGFMGTAVNRSFGREELRASINGQAYAGGLDAWTQFGGGRFVLKGFLAASTISGTATQIARVQRSSVHFLQRPDRTALRYDPSRTTAQRLHDPHLGRQDQGRRLLQRRLRGRLAGLRHQRPRLPRARRRAQRARDDRQASTRSRPGIFQRRWVGARRLRGRCNYDGDRTGTGVFGADGKHVPQLLGAQRQRRFTAPRDVRADADARWAGGDEPRRHQRQHQPRDRLAQGVGHGRRPRRLRSGRAGSRARHTSACAGSRARTCASRSGPTSRGARTARSTSGASTTPPPPSPRRSAPRRPHRATSSRTSNSGKSAPTCASTGPSARR